MCCTRLVMCIADRGRGDERTSSLADVSRGQAATGTHASAIFVNTYISSTSPAPVLGCCVLMGGWGWYALVALFLSVPLALSDSRMRF
jgi:hypothetical protein